MPSHGLTELSFHNSGVGVNKSQLCGPQPSQENKEQELSKSHMPGHTSIQEMVNKYRNQYYAANKQKSLNQSDFKQDPKAVKTTKQLILEELNMKQLSGSIGPAIPMIKSVRINKKSHLPQLFKYDPQPNQLSENRSINNKPGTLS